MKKIGIPLKFLDFKREVSQTIDAWFREVTDRFSIYLKSGAFNVDQLANNEWAITKDTNHGVVGLAINDSGVLKSLYVPPVFYAYRGGISNQASGIVYNVLVYDNELFDTESWYDTTTGTFQPSLEGYYLLTAQIECAIVGAVPTCSVSAAFLKNGVTWSENRTTVPAGINNTFFVTLTTILYLNGTTDYVQVGVWQNSGAVQSFAGLGISTSNYFSGTLVRGAA